MSETDKELCDRVLALTSTYGVTCSKDDARELATRLRGRASGQQATPNADAVEVAAKAMWDSEPVVFAWGPPERRQASWEEAVERNLVGVEIFRQFARAMLSALAASPQITTPAEENKVMAFYARYAMPMLAAPSCLVCGQSTQGQKPAIEHLALPSVVVCQSCAKRAAQPSDQAIPDIYAKLERDEKGNIVETHPVNDLLMDAGRKLLRDVGINPTQPSDSVQGWQPIETAPYATPVLAWLHLPKNPIASAVAIAHRVYVENEDAAEDYPEHERITVGCWWANGRYYAAGHVTGWQPLPEPPGGNEQ